VELLSPLAIILFFSLGLVLLGWFLLTRFQGLKGLKVEERVKEIIQYLSRMQEDFSKFQDDFGLLGKQLGHIQSTYQVTEQRLEHFGRRLFAANRDPELVEYPSNDRKTG
jgi:hypothetical protein